MEENREIEQYIADAIMERPHGFSIDNNGETMHLYLYPITLGKMFLLQRQIEALGINYDTISKDVTVEAMRLAKEKKNECLNIICYHTCRTKEEVFDTVLVSERKEKLENSLSDEDIAALMIILLTTEKTNLFTKHLGIDKEHERLNIVTKVKQDGDKNSLTFGGKSQFGTLIDSACERYGWTKQYVVWGIDYTSLRLMLADKITSVYLTDEERKKLPAWVLGDGNFIKADDPKNKELIKSMNWK